MYKEMNRDVGGEMPEKQGGGIREKGMQDRQEAESCGEGDKCLDSNSGQEL